MGEDSSTLPFDKLTAVSKVEGKPQPYIADIKARSPQAKLALTVKNTAHDNGSSPKLPTRGLVKFA